MSWIVFLFRRTYETNPCHFFVRGPEVAATGLHLGTFSGALQD